MGARNYASDFGERVRTARQLKGWTHTELSEQTGLSSDELERLERGETRVAVSVTARIAEALGITVDHLSPTRSGTHAVTKRG